MLNAFNSESGADEANPREEPYPGAQLSVDGGVPSIVSALTINGVVPSAAGRRNSSNAAALQAPASAYEGLTDAEIMLQVKAGDDAAYEYLVVKFRRPVLGFLYRMSHNAAVAEELTQEVFLRVYRSRHTYNADAKFTTWLYRIASNLAVNHARDTKHERTEASVSLNDPDPETGMTLDLADQRLTAEQDLLRRERLRAIRQHVEALPERQRLAVVMHKYQEMDYRQIAETLKLSESATKSLLFRAYETLRQRLAEFI
jgi:RNA polymerase sigma-70 factor (ECF subfamily)